MTDSRALDADRLPWLTNDVKPATRRGVPSIVTLGVAVLLLVAGGAYWAGRTMEVPADDAAWTDVGETVQLPDAAVVREAPPVVEIAPPPVVVEQAPPRIAPVQPSPGERAAVAPETRAKAASTKKVTQARPKTVVKRPRAAKASAKASPAKASPAKKVRREAHWPRPADAVPLGRIIRIGTYSTPEKNHKAWQTALRRYPQMQGLPKIIGVYQDKRGRSRIGCAAR